MPTRPNSHSMVDMRAICARINRSAAGPSFKMPKHGEEGFLHPQPRTGFLGKAQKRKNLFDLRLAQLVCGFIDRNPYGISSPF